MSWAGSVLNIVDGALGMAGTIADGQARDKQRRWQVGLANDNAKLVGDQSATREAQVRRDNRQWAGAQAAAIAESGTGQGGSNLLVQQHDAVLAELDALNARYEGKLRMSDYDNQRQLLMGGADQMSTAPMGPRIHRALGLPGWWSQPSDWGRPDKSGFR